MPILLPMDDSVLALIASGDTPEAQQLLLPYFEALKKTDEGLQACGDILAHNAHNSDRVLFFCLQVLESHIKERYALLTAARQESLQRHLEDWYRHCCASMRKAFIVNKTAQLYCLVFVQEYPQKWLNVFNDMLSILSMGPAAVDIYLRVLIAIDEEVVQRYIPHSQIELDRNTRIKDHMRDHCVKNLVSSWFDILQMYELKNSELICLCLRVIGLYVSWIDISLIACDKFVGVLLGFLNIEDVRETACECFLEIINKGMSATAKTRLVENITAALEKTGVLTASSDALDGDFAVKLSQLVDGIGVQLIASYDKLTEAEIRAGAKVEILQAIDRKINHMLRFLSDEDDDVSQGVFEFCHSYIILMKSLEKDELRVHKNQLRDIFVVVVTKMKYDKDYNFEKEGESEVEFLEFRKQMKVLMDNIAIADENLVLSAAHSLFMSTLSDWQSKSFLDVEVAIHLLYLLGEALPGQQLYADPSKFAVFQEMMILLLNSGVSEHKHSAVKLQYFETVARYERFFYAQNQYVPTVLVSFLDERGLRNPNAAVSSRTCFLLMRFIKALKNQVQPYVDDILKRMQGLLVSNSQENGVNNLSENDLYYLYEVAAILITCQSQEKQLVLMQGLLSPVLVKFKQLLETMTGGRLDDLSMLNAATEMEHLMAYCSRASKAFSSQQSMKASGAAACFSEALTMFLHSLTIHVHREIIHNGVRQYLHRMIICLGEDVLPFIPVAVNHLLKDCQVRDVQEFIPLINQVIARFKGQIAPYLSEIFMALVTQIFLFIQAPVEVNDQQAIKEKQMLQRSYFLFISTIVNNNIVQVLSSQKSTHVKEIFISLVHGAVEIPDPQGQKTCFVTFNKLIDVWGSNGETELFREFIYDYIMPSCFVAPLKPSFSLDDAQTVLVLQEIAATQKNILDKRGHELLNWLQSSYFPQNNCPPDIIAEYCHALQHMNLKAFKNYLKVFYARWKT